MAARDAADPQEAVVTPLAILEQDKLAALPIEQQELYLLSFTTDWSLSVIALDTDGCTTHQAAIQQQAFSILSLKSPPLNRVVNKNLARTLASCMGRSNRRLNGDTLTRLAAIVTAKDSSLRARHAAAQCLGAVMEAAGDSAMTQVMPVFAALLKCVKLGQNHVGLRSTAYSALASTIKGTDRMLDEVTAREIWKLARYAAQSDKAFTVQTSACAALGQLVAMTKYFDTANDLDKLMACMWKTADSPSRLVRTAAAAIVADALLKNYSDEIPVTPVPQPKKSKKVKKAPEDADPTEDEPAPLPTASNKNAATVTYSLVDIMRIFSTQFTKSTASNNLRATVFLCYKNILTLIGETIVERNYLQIVKHLIQDLVSHPTIAANRFRTLLARKHVRLLLHDVVGDMLGGRAQLAAAQLLISEILKDYPVTLKERPEPSKQALVVVLGALMALIDRLQAAFSPLAETCRQSLMSVVQHPSFTVQVHAARALRVLVSACPEQSLPTITICMNNVFRETSHLSNQRQSPRRCTAFAAGLAALLKASSSNPLHGSIDVYVRVLDQASSLLKSSGTSTLRVSSTQVSVAWTIMGGLMSLGTSFVKPQLSQLLLLWRNALPQPPTKEEMSKRTLLELGYLAHVRECSLATLWVFLHYNSRLVTADVARRIAAMLDNTTAFVNTLPVKGPTDDPANRLSPALQLHDLHDMLRRRLFQCCASLIVANPNVVSDVSEYSNFLGSALSCFADAERTRPASLSSSISSSAGTFGSIWEVCDNWAFGLNGVVKHSGMRPLSFEDKDQHEVHRRQDIVDDLTRQPIGEGLEHDSVQNYLSTAPPDDMLPQSAVTESINAAIDVFALIFPTQPPRVQSGILEQISAYMNASPGTSSDPTRRAATYVNIATALLLATKALKGQTPGPAGKIQSTAVEQSMQEILHVLIIDPDMQVRNMASEALGRLCGLCGSDFTNSEVTALISMIVSNREPSARAGYALSLSYIHLELGGMAASFHLNNIVGVLMSLAADPNSTVHYWALESLCRVIQSAGLTFSGHVSSSIGLLSQLYVRDTHNADDETVDASNLETTNDTIVAITRCIEAIISVLGPDLQDLAKPRNMILTLLRQLDSETSPGVVSENMRCWEHVCIYAPSHVEFEQYIRQLQDNLSSTVAEVRKGALRALADAIRKDSAEVVRVAEDGLEDKLWDILDDQPDHPIVHEIFQTWLQQTGLSDMSAWVQRCFAVLSKTKRRAIDDKGASAAEQSRPAAPELQDEEVAGFAASTGGKDDANTGAGVVSAELMRWQVRSFAMDLMLLLLGMIYKDSVMRDDSPALEALQQQVGEVIKIAFSASTADVGSLRIRGLRTIDRILKMFGAVPDPDFTEAMLLEQYQAQITSALTPAFAADSSPELAAEAVNVCATFIATGIVTEVDRMGRILKLLVSALETFSAETKTASIGDLQGLSFNAGVMVEMAVLSAWAELQVASAEHPYLDDVVKPHVAKLTPMWLSSLQEYARLRFEPDVSDSLGTSQSPEVMYAALNRETILKFYQDAWLKLVEAIASLIDQDSEFVFDALDGKVEGASASANGDDPRTMQNINYRDEPAAFFFVLFGLAFEALASRDRANGDAITERTKRLEILGALRKILRPSVTGVAIYQGVVFSETMDLFDRMILTEGTDVQMIVVEIARDLCITHPSSRLEPGRAKDDENLSDDIEQLFELSRIIVLALTGLVPGLADTGRPIRTDGSEETVALARLALDALVDAAEAFPAIIKGDLHACILHLFTTILATASCQASLVPQALPIFKRFIASMVGDETGSVQSPAADLQQQQLCNTLGRFLSILRHAQKRETAASLPCEKNTLLACTILVTTAQCSLSTKIDQEKDTRTSHEGVFVRDFIAELVESIDSVATSSMAAGCARSILLASASTSGNDTSTISVSSVAPQLLARLVNLLSGPTPELESLAQSRVLIAQTLVNYACSIVGSSTESNLAASSAALYAIVIETLLARVEASDAALSRANFDNDDHAQGSRGDEDGEEDWITAARSIRLETASRLLELASHDQGLFKSTILRMREGRRGLLEGVLRIATDSQGGGGKGRKKGMARGLGHGHSVGQNQVQAQSLDQNQWRQYDDGDDDDDDNDDEGSGGARSEEPSIALKMEF